MSDELELKRYVDQAKVVELYLQGNNETNVAKSLGLKRGYVMELIADYKEVARNDNATKEKARELLAGLGEHFSALIRKSYEIIEAVDNSVAPDDAKMLAQKAGALKLIGDFEQKRLDAYHRAGLLDDEELANDIAETEMKIEALKELMIRVSSDCDHCRLEIAKGLSKIFDETVEVVKGETV